MAAFGYRTITNALVRPLGLVCALQCWHVARPRAVCAYGNHAPSEREGRGAECICTVNSDTPKGHRHTSERAHAECVSVLQPQNVGCTLLTFCTLLFNRLCQFYLLVSHLSECLKLRLDGRCFWLAQGLGAEEEEEGRKEERVEEEEEEEKGKQQQK